MINDGVNIVKMRASFQRQDLPQAIPMTNPACAPAKPSMV